MPVDDFPDDPGSDAPPPEGVVGEPAPAPVATPEPAHPAEPVHADAEHIGRAWPRILGILEQRSPHLHAFLQGSEVQRVADGLVTVGVNGGVAVAMLDRPDERGAIERVLKDMTGETLLIKVVELPSAAAAAAAAPAAAQADDGPVDHNRIIEEIRSAFDAEVIDTTEKE